MDDRAAHERWQTARDGVWDAYRTAFGDVVHEFVMQTCRGALDTPRSADQRPVGDPVVGERSPNDIEHDHLARASYLGAWAALAEASPLRITGPQAEAVVYRAENPFTPPAVAAGQLPVPPAPNRLPFGKIDLRAANADRIEAVRAELTRAWESGRDAVWTTAVWTAAMRRLGLPEHEQILAQVSTDRLRALARSAGAPDRPPRPYVRPALTNDLSATAPIPDGWVAQPIGPWGGRESELVYDRRRFDITITTDTPIRVAFLEGRGWHEQAADARRAIWIRDRAEATRDVLTRLDSQAASMDAAKPGPAAPRQPPGLEL